MDSILRANSILGEKNWLYFKLYRNPGAPSDWKSQLDWYHQTLINAVRPVILNTPEIRVVFFGLYGPTGYASENEIYERQISPPTNDLIFMRLRFSVFKGSKRRVRNAFLASIRRTGTLVWDYEVMRTFHVYRDLGNRYGSNNNAQTLQFIRYWDAACRYILSILALPGNWTRGVDVWGIPHLVNNSLGAWLRPERNPVPCPNCGTHAYMATRCKTSVNLNVTTDKFPVCFFICPNCSREFFGPFSI